MKWIASGAKQLVPGRGGRLFSLQASGRYGPLKDSMVLSAKVFWPLFPLLMLVVIVALTWALVYATRRSKGATAVWLQALALSFYLLAAIAALASERKAMSAHVHRPFSFLTQAAIAVALYYLWRRGERRLIVLNSIAWAAILADTALHYVMVR
jgi:hypothetical protein